MRLAVLALFALLLTILPRSLHAGALAPIVVDDAFGGGSIGTQIEILEDDTEALSIDDARAMSAEFRPSTRDTPSFGLTRSAIWLRLRVLDRRKGGGPLRLEVRHAVLDRVDLYLPGEATPIRNGDAVPIARRPIAFRHPVFELRPNGGDATYYLRVASTSSVQLPVRLWTAERFEEIAAREAVAQGGYVGFVAAVMLYTLYIAFALRSRTHVRYAVFLLAFLAFQTSAEGLTHQFLWPSNPWLADHAVIAFVAFASAAALSFAVDFLSIALFAPRVSVVLRRAGHLLSVLGVASVFLPVREFTGLLTFATMAMCLAIVSTALWALRVVDSPRARRPLWLFCFAWAVLLAGTAIFALRVREILPSNPFTMHAQQIASLIEVAILALALADRVDVLRSEADEDRELALVEEIRASTELAHLNAELRRQIAERSRALADAIAGVSAAAVNALSPGELFDGRYRVVRALGKGGMGAVVEVERVSDGRRLALKLIAGDATPEASARFAREGEIAARLSHPNLVSIVDVGVAEGGALYLVMELVPGASLAELRDGFGEPLLAIAVLGQLAEGLAALHAAGIVHRDLKPANVLVEQGPAGIHARIADFGIARVVHPSEAGAGAGDVDGSGDTVAAPSPHDLTATGAWLGTPPYMAPELVEGVRGARPPADVFAFGVIAYELLTRKAAFASPPIYDALAGRTIEPPTSLATRIASTDGATDGVTAGPSERLVALLDRALAIDPAKRPSAEELASAFRAAPRAEPKGRG